MGPKDRPRFSPGAMESWLWSTGRNGAGMEQSRLHIRRKSNGPQHWTVLRHTGNARGPVRHGTCHAGRVQQPLSPKAGTMLSTVLKGHKTPSLPPWDSGLAQPWLWHLPGAPWCQSLHQIQSHFLTPSPPKYATYIHPGAPSSRERTKESRGACW